MKFLYLPLLLVLFFSCKKKEMKAGEWLHTGNQSTYRFPNGELITIVLEEDGFDFLYLGRSHEFSVAKKDGAITTIADYRGDKRYTVIDGDGDFLPDYMFKEGKRLNLETIEKNIETVIEGKEIE